jgi:DUF4097 and DUF4098 domain-containing protein YvlB
MKRIALFALVLFVAAYAGSSRLLAQGKETKTFSVAKGGGLELDTKAGSIAVNVWDKNEIAVTVQGIQDADRQYLTMTQTGNKLKVSFQPPELRARNNIQFDLSLPVEFDQNLRTGGGEVKVANQQSIAGNVRIMTGGGEIKIGDVNGDLNVRTGGGNVTCGFISGTANIQTGGGTILARGAGRNINISTGGGAITIEEAAANTVATTGGGNLSVNKSSGKLTMSTGGGNISIRNSNGDLSVGTGGGNLAFKNVTGSITGGTGGGGISAEINPVGKDTTLGTGVGDIDLMLPPSAKATVVARIRSRPHSDMDISCEFGSAEKGESRQEKTYLINSGGPRILLETNIGKIRIRKAAQ